MYTGTLHIVAFLLHAISSGLLFAVNGGENLLMPVGLVALNEAITAVAHAAGFSIYRMDIEIKEMNNYDSWRRWIEYSITAFLVEAALLIAMGQDYAGILIMVLALNIVTQMMGRVIDEHMQEEKNIRWLYVVVPLMAFAAILVEIITTAIGTEFVPLTVMYGVLYSLFAVHQITSAYKWDITSVDYDDMYILLSITAKLVLSWGLVARLRVDTDDGVRWDVFEPVFPSIMGALLLGMVWAMRKRSADSSIVGANVEAASEFKIINF